MSLINHLVQNKSRFYRQCCKLTRDIIKADDLFQDTCEFLLKHKPKEEVRHINTYVTQVIIHRWLNTVRSKDNRKFSIMADLFNNEAVPEKYLAFNNETLENMIKEENTNIINKAIDQLPKSQKEAILKVLETDIIVADQDENYNTLKANRRHGFLKLKAYFIENDIDFT